MKLSDYVVDYIAARGTKHVFLVTGGAIAHVVDSLGRRATERKDISYVCVQHEQAGAMAAEAYSRFDSGVGVAMATSGPGATNLITGMCGCWFDSIPTVFITGQVNTKESLSAAKAKPRQVGFQETDIVSIVKPITKFAVLVTKPQDIKYCLDKAYYLARESRPGPVLVDIPVDVQVANINPKTLKGFVPSKSVSSTGDSLPRIEKKIQQTIGLLKKSKRPVILLGGGVRIARAEKEARALVEKLRIPAVVSWSGFDLLPYNHPQFVGHIGVYGHRGANFAVQNADFLLSIGSRIDTRQTGGKVAAFARGAKKAMVDIDVNEIKKGRGLAPDIGIAMDAKKFTALFGGKINSKTVPEISSWVERTREWKKRYHAVLPAYAKEKNISAYTFVQALSRTLKKNETIFVDTGGALVWTIQSFEVKEGQRIISTFGNSPMGYAFPAAIGASFALERGHVVCISGDGGFQSNIQELQTLKKHNLPVKIFVLNNRSMGIIKQFQDAYFDSRYHASSEKKGYSAPDFVKIAEGYGIPAVRITRTSETAKVIAKVLAYKGPILCDVRVAVDQKLNPKLEFGRSVEDMSPYLPREEFIANMPHTEPLPESKETPKKTGWQSA